MRAPAVGLPLPDREGIEGTPALTDIPQCWYIRAMQDGRLLSAEEFAACFAQPMRDVTKHAEPVVDIWPYVEGLDLDAVDLPALHDVRHVYRDARARFDQVLIG